MKFIIKSVYHISDGEGIYKVCFIGIALALILVIVWIAYAMYGTDTIRCGTFSTYDPASQDCCGGKVFGGTNWRDCQGSCYNEDSHDCCGGMIYEGNTWQECNEACYDSRTQDCCNGTVYSDTKWEVCGGTCYNSRYQTCWKNSNLIKATETCCKDQCSLCPASLALTHDDRCIYVRKKKKTITISGVRKDPPSGSGKGQRI